MLLNDPHTKYTLFKENTFQMAPKHLDSGLRTSANKDYLLIIVKLKLCKSSKNWKLDWNWKTVNGKRYCKTKKRKLKKTRQNNNKTTTDYKKSHQRDWN